MSTFIIRSVPKRAYWFMGIWLYPIACFVFTSVLLIPTSSLFHYHVSRPQILASWATVTLAISALAYVRDYRRLYYTLTSETLIWGRGNSAEIIPFSEIDSIVTGLPDRLPWWIRIQRFGGGPGTYQVLAARWKSVPVLRLRGSRYLPLDTGTGRLFFRDFDTLVAELLRLNAPKVTGPGSYDEREIRCLVAARYNIIKTI